MSETGATVAAKFRGRYGAATDQRSKFVDEVEPADTLQRHRRTANGNEDGRDGSGSTAASGGRRRRQRTAARQRKSRRQPDAMTSPLRRVDVDHDEDDDDDDDAGSVCSGASSASEKSAASRGSGSGRTGSRSRGPPRSSQTPSRCRRRASRDTPRQTEPTLVSRKSPPSDCPIRSTDETVSDTRCDVKRPEPEGGVRAAPYYKSAMSDEFERLIYGPSEPLFSDGEDAVTSGTLNDVNVTKDCAVAITTSTGVRYSQLQLQRRRAAVDADETTEGIFYAAQSINTNVMMKFTVIQMELRNVKDVSLRRVWRFRYSCCRITYL